MYTSTCHLGLRLCAKSVNIHSLLDWSVPADSGFFKPDTYRCPFNTKALEKLSLQSLHKRRHRLDTFYLIQVYSSHKSCTSILEDVSFLVPTRNVRDITSSRVCPSNRHCPACCSVRLCCQRSSGGYTSRHICNRSGSIQSYFIIFYLKLLIMFVHNSNVLVLCTFQLYFLCVFSSSLFLLFSSSALTCFLSPVLACNLSVACKLFFLNVSTSIYTALCL
jgi:hypothetical protein